MKRILHLLAAGALFAGIAPATAVFAFDPIGGSLSGTPGSTVGWGFTISDSTEFVLIMQSDFCPPGSVEGDLTCPNSPVGTYNDFTGGAPIIGPSPDSPSVTQAFVLATEQGYGSFHISPTAGIGTVLPGEIAIVYLLFTGDPNTDPTATQIGGDNFTSLPASITVIGGATVPEPSAILPLGIALLWSFRRLKTSPIKSRQS
jgi:hypothetical protein